MENQSVKLIALTNEDRKQFILDNQEAFRYGATEEFGMRDDHFEEDGEIISGAAFRFSARSRQGYRLRRMVRN